jgi:hypothetical protein
MAEATVMSIDSTDVFVVIRWPAESGFPRYTFATLPHADTLQAQMPIEKVEFCSSIEAAASRAARLNAEEGGG